MNRDIDPGRVFETLNGIQVILTTFFIIFLITCMIKFARRDGITLKRWLWDAPLRYQVATALFVVHLGYVLVRFVAWSWRFHGTAPFTMLEWQALLLGTFLSTVGLFCMIRVFTKPFYGNWPWVVTAIVSVVYFAVVAAFHF